ncbi:MAG: hypothetical protein HOO91_17975 [Bacteroidales bacterium]|nr:hypothetical protein [Bacteroidales bacterium]
MIKKPLLFLSLIILLLLSTSKTNAQCSFILADKFDNVWVVNNHEIICFDKQFKKIGSYSNILLGNPAYIDVLDPFRILVFYQGSQSVVILNNAVAEISEPIKFQDKGISDVTLVCRSNKGGFWVFNRNRWEILYFDSSFNPTGEKIIPDMTFSDTRPTFIQENKGILYLAFQNKGICRFDSFGARMGDIPVKIDSYFTFIDGSMVYFSEGKLFQYILDGNQVKAFDVSFSCIPIKFRGKFLFYNGSELVVS